MGYTLPSACMPSGNMAAMISPTSLPNAAPDGHTWGDKVIYGVIWIRQEECRFQKYSELCSPIKNTGMKAPHGTGMVVATADIQNWNEGGKVITVAKSCAF